jgi:epoxyqueuosine reductase QueG
MGFRDLVVDRVFGCRDNTKCSPWNIKAKNAAVGLPFQIDEPVEAKEHGCRKPIRLAKGLYANLDVD